mgnify:CR=1 FL=1
MILRVDRADLSKNVLRGFSAFDLFLEQHPEFSEKVTFIAQLMPSRTDVPEYAEYLERIEALKVRAKALTVEGKRPYNPGWHLALDLPNMLTVSECIARAALERARTADVVVKASGVGVFDELLEQAVLEQKTPRQLVVFWDVDAPATLDRVEKWVGHDA